MPKLVHVAAALLLSLSSCSRDESKPATPPAAAPASSVDRALAAVASAHGRAGPWAVAGYRMGVHAMNALGLPQGSFDLEVEHHSPKSVQYACIADGAAAATGASVGKLSLRHVDSELAQLETIYRNRKTGASLRLRPSKAFAERFTNVPMDKLEAAGRDVLTLPDAEVFELIQ